MWEISNFVKSIKIQLSKSMKNIVAMLALLSLSIQTGEAQQPSNYSTIFSDYDQKGPYVGMDDFSQEETLSLMRGLLKHWTLCYHTKDGGYMVREFCVDPRDSIVNDRSYARVTLEKWGSFYGSSDTPVDTLLYRQEGDKVYLLSPTDGKDMLLLDYGLSLGEQFVSPQGKTFVVTAVGHAEDLAKMGSPYWNDGCKIKFDETYGPKVLCLKSEDGQEEDLWIEGAGSACCGIVPAEIVEGLRDAPSQIVKSNLLHAPGIDMDVVFSLDEEDCKLVYFEPEDIDYSQVDPDDYERYVAEHPLEYTFRGDTLCISGLADLNCVTAYAMCDIKDRDISIKLDHFYPLGVMLPCKSYRFANVRIPGFKAGEYTIGGVTLVCKGANGVENISETLRHENQKGGVYDLSGRRVNAKAYENENQKLKKGIYIKDGKKTVVR